MWEGVGGGDEGVGENKGGRCGGGSRSGGAGLREQSAGRCGELVEGYGRRIASSGASGIGGGGVPRVTSQGEGFIGQCDMSSKEIDG